MIYIYMNQTQLTVYKASAGSGKTFTLACEYMTLVIADPSCFRTILAVTFTNKATEEMKLRILSQLYGISRQLPESNDYLKQIQQALPYLSEEMIAKNAGIALNLLIHNYNYFRVETIDTFFQSVLRNLARELDLTANLRIGLNDCQVEQQAVDELIESLQDHDTLLLWILDYIKDNIADDKSWNVIGQIKDFGTNIFKDFYKDNASRLEKCISQKGFFEAYQQKMRGIAYKANEQIQEVAASFFDALEENGITVDDLNRGKTGIWSYFNKLKQGKITDKDLINSTFEKCYKDPENWVRKGDRTLGNPLLDCVTNILHPILVFSEENRPKLTRLYFSAKLTEKHLSQLRLLSSIDKKVREMNEEANRFLLSDTQTLLHSLIQESDSPFIFEKIGTQLEHVMIDEFQDTSTIQWKNFKVLLDETMSSQNSDNLIVGDVKQSIYRWRSGDWRLLNNIDKEFNESEKVIDIKNLDTNYRSDRNIIEFNNVFFSAIAKFESDALKEDNPSEAHELENAYADVTQNVPSQKNALGLVRIQLLHSKAEDDDMMDQILSVVNELVSNGIELSQIAILVRNNKTIQDIAGYFMNHSDYNMVSDEAFRLEASQAVMTIVTTLRFLIHPQDEISKATLEKYANLTLGPGNHMIEQLENERELLLQTPLYELVEKIYHDFSLSTCPEMKQQTAYIYAFYDKLNTFLIENSSDIEAFLDEWDSSIHEKSIHSDQTDGIRLLTIHKSKGLEFDHAIIPYCDWKLEQNSTIWCEPKVAPFDELPLVPVDFTASQMKNSIYEQDYLHEHLQNMVDNLNLLYVAFTRASRGLYIIGRRNNKNTSRSSAIEACLSTVEEELKNKQQPLNLQGIGTKVEEEDVFFEFGTMDTGKKKQKNNNTSNVFTMPSESICVEIQCAPTLPDFRQSNKSRDFIKGDENEEQQKRYIQMGTVLHSLFSTIHTHEDLEGAMKQLELDGILYDDYISKPQIENLIRKRLESPIVKDWFSSHWQVMNECTILEVKEGKVKEHRPDRVMKDGKKVVVIDFKFGKQKDEHVEQVKRYMNLLYKMGHQFVKGYLWYVYPNKIIEVKA